MASLSPAERSQKILTLILQELDDDKAENIVTIDLAGKSDIADAMVVASGRSQRHVGAMADQIMRRLKAAGFNRGRIEGAGACDWVLIDAEDVIVGSTNATLFAYVADGRNGLKVIQLTTPDSQKNFYGFSPAPKPELIAFARTPKPALALSKGLDRDRAVDETGGQMAVFGRLGSRPFTRSEMQRFYLNSEGKPYFVRDEADLADWIGPVPPMLAKR